VAEPRFRFGQGPYTRGKMPLLAGRDHQAPLEEGLYSGTTARPSRRASRASRSFHDSQATYVVLCIQLITTKQSIHKNLGEKKNPYSPISRALARRWSTRVDDAVGRSGYGDVVAQ